MVSVQALGFIGEQDATLTLIEQQTFPAEIPINLDLKDGQEFAGGMGGGVAMLEEIFMAEGTAYVKVSQFERA